MSQEAVTPVATPDELRVRHCIAYIMERLWSPGFQPARVQRVLQAVPLLRATSSIKNSGQSYDKQGLYDAVGDAVQHNMEKYFKECKGLRAQFPWPGDLTADRLNRTTTSSESTPCT